MNVSTVTVGSFAGGSFGGMGRYVAGFIVPPPSPTPGRLQGSTPARHPEVSAMPAPLRPVQERFRGQVRRILRRAVLKLPLFLWNSTGVLIPSGSADLPVRSSPPSRLFYAIP